MSLDKMVLFEQEMIKAQDAGVVEGLPAAAAGSDKINNLQQIEPVLRDRLFRLGYLTETEKQESGDNSLQQAIRQLQKEAGLTVDGWIGTQTWSALQELFTFENPSNLEKWKLDHPNQFVWRTVELRLITLGLITDRKHANLAPFEDAWQSWREVCQKLSLVNKLSNQAELIKVLFDIDNLTLNVNKQRARIKVLCSQQNAEGKKLEHFVSCLLKVELWLHGYQDVRPNGTPFDLNRIKVRQGRAPRYKYSLDYRFLRRFWRDSGVSIKHADNIVMLLRGFSVLEQIEQHAVTHTEHKAVMVEEISRQMAEDMNASQQEWQKQGWGAWVWDGLKRVFRTIVGWLKRLGHMVSQTLRLVVRSAKQLVSESFSYVRRTFRILEDGAALFLNRHIRGSNHLVSMSHDGDFDFKVFVSSTASIEDVDKLTGPLNQQLTRFKAALRLVDVFLNVLRGAVTIVSLGWNWWRLLKVLLNINQLITSEDRDILQAAYQEF